MERIMKCLPTIDQAAGIIAAYYALSQFLVDQVYKIYFTFLIYNVKGVQPSFGINCFNSCQK